MVNNIHMADGRTLDGEIRWSPGGVARNIADALARLGTPVTFVSAIGSDHFGKYLKEESPNGLVWRTVEECEKTAVCLVACDNSGNNRLLVGDMGAHTTLTPHNLRGIIRTLSDPSLIVFDGNIPAEGMKFILEYAAQSNIPVFFEPTDLLRAKRPFQLSILRPISFISPNLSEFCEIVREILPLQASKLTDSLESVGNAALLVTQHVDNVLVTLGQDGILIARRGSDNDPFFIQKEGKPQLIQCNSPVSYRVYAPDNVPKDEIVNVSGAGDCFASGFITAMLKGLPERKCVAWGFQASRAALFSWNSVPQNLGEYVNNSSNKVSK